MKEIWKALPTLGKVCIVIALLALYSILFGMYEWHRGYNEAINSMEEDTTETSTIIKWDTIEIDKPIPVTQYLVRYKTDTLPLVIHDTLPNGNAIVQVPISQKIYEDSLYRAYVSGYRPNLDSISIYNRTVTHTTTITKTLLKKPKISLSAGIGYYYTLQSKKLEPAVGVTIGIPIKNIY